MAFKDKPPVEQEEIKYQNDLINHRLTWLGVFEGLLFVAYGTGQHPYLLPVLGFLIALTIDEGIRTANKALAELEGRQSPLMPGTVIPKIIAGAWLLLLIQTYCKK